MMYTEEQVIKAIEMAKDCSEYKYGIPKEQILQSLQPKIESIEVETEKYAVCKGCNQVGMRHCAHPEECDGWEEFERPITCQKDGKTFLKVTKINYGK